MPERVARSGPLARNIAAPAHLEIFLVSAVSAFLAIRVFLELAGWPQIGGDRWHVAHMLWGGLLMVAGLFVLLSFLGGAAETLGAVLAGLGFGTFIDEIGKFLTRDHDYFFQPAVALVYVTFVLLFLAGHVVHGRRRYSPHEYLLNALRETEQLVIHDLDPDEKERVLRYLAHSDRENPLVRSLERAVGAVEPVPLRAAAWPARLRAVLRRGYRRLTALRGFDLALIAVFVGQLLVKLAYAAALALLSQGRLQDALSIELVQRVAARLQDVSWPDVAQLAFSGLAGLFVLIGVVRLRTSRVAAYRWFERAVLVSILLVQVFTFVDRQLGGLLTLGANLVLLGALRTAITLEREAAA